MSEIETFRKTIEDFLSASGMSATQFGRVYANDPLFVFQVREGREPRTKTRIKVLDNMRLAPKRPRREAREAQV